MLTTFLARIDALHAPARDLGPRATLHQLRDDFHRHNGLTWHAAGDAATRQRLIREAEAEAEAGRLVMTKAGSAFRVRLTDTAEEDLRCRCCVSTYAQARGLLGLLRDALDAGHGFEHTGRTWLRETRLCGVGYCDSDAGQVLGLLEEATLPLLTRDLLLANCDRAGRCWFALTAAGMHAAQGIAAGEPQHHQPQAKARREYLKAFNAERERLTRTPPPNPREIGPIPLPEGVNDEGAA